MRYAIPVISGLLFGLGLTISDMIDAARILAFLDVAGGAWDPTLAFVLMGAMTPMFIAWAVSGRRARPVLAESFPAKPGEIDGKLVLGASIFGVGFGLVGWCPGPALAGLTVVGFDAALYVLAMVAGMAAYLQFLARLPQGAPA